MLLKDSYFLPIYQNSLASKSASVLRKRPNMFNLRIHAGLDVFFPLVHIPEYSLSFFYLHRILNHDFYVNLPSTSYMREDSISLEIHG